MKRFLSAFLALCLSLAICPLSALAAGSTANNSERLYKDVLDTCYSALMAHWSRDTLQSNNLSYLYAYLTGDSASEIGYTFIDIDGNGVQELLIGAVDTDDFYDGMIYDLYTLSNGNTVHILSSGERDRYYLCTDGSIMNEGSSGAATSLVGFYSLKGSALSLHEIVIFDSTDTPSSPWYYSATETEDPFSQEDRIPISESKATEVINSYQCETLSFSSFSLWPARRTAQSETTKTSSPTLFLQPTEPADLAEALLTVHSGGLIAEGDAVTFHPGGLMGQAIPVTVLGLLSGLTLGQATPKAPSYVVDYLGMTLDQITAIWGDDYVTGGWWYGGSLLIYYEDYRTPCSFFISDPTLRGFPEGDEPIQFLFCDADTLIPIAKGINANSTYSQLQAAGITGEFLTGEEANSGDGESTKLYYSYSPTITIEFSWYEGSDPYTTPPGGIFIFSSSTQ